MDSTTNSGTSRRTLLKALGTGLVSTAALAAPAAAKIGDVGDTSADLGSSFARSNVYRPYFRRRRFGRFGDFQLTVHDYCGTGTTFDFDSYDAWLAGDTEVEFVGPYGSAYYRAYDWGGFEFQSPTVYIDCDYNDFDVRLIDNARCPVVNFDVDEYNGELDIRYADGGFIKVDSNDGYYGRRYWY
ncbi:hypothetical protein [Haloarchaeobius amylolyticus]|uniref:hypothetical protein n=1 Tax=Haloarchaeobius amylolyticus TaxID=1198296 RepID=UPI00226EDD7F|nr:hypothetical protein [Haloarchaeobius amylolyticus]